MNPEDICTSLELSKRLKELDVEQDSLFYWHWYKKNRDYEDIRCYLSDKNAEEFDDGKWQLRVYSAFTASELLAKLPKRIDNCSFEIICIPIIHLPYDHRYGYAVRYRTIHLDKKDEHYQFLREELNTNITTSLSKMLIYLLKNKIIDVNKENFNENISR